jgi:hypothetical protein
VIDVKRLLLLSAVAYGVWTLIKAARQREALEASGHPPAKPSATS